MATATITAEDLASPRSNPHLLGQTAAEATLLRAWQSGRMPHAWLLAGPRGVGKATLAYRFARFVFAEGAAAAANQDQGGLFGGPAAAAPPPDSMALDPSHPIFRRVASGGHPDLFVLERGLMHPDTKKPTNEIVVAHVRRVNEQVRMTPVEGGWRIAIVDEAEAMNPNAANAFLKLLEEPPAKALILLVSHAPGRLLPTIRSRCRLLAMPPLADADVAHLLASSRPDLGDGDRAILVRLGAGSVGRALELESRGGADLYQELITLLGKLPKLDVAAVHAFAERMARRAGDSEDAAAGFRTTIELLVDWTARVIKFAAAGIPSAWESERALAGRLAPQGPQAWMQAADRIEEIRNATEGLNLDRKQALIAAFLAVEAAAT